MPYLLPTARAEGVEHVPMRTHECTLPGRFTSAREARRIVRRHLQPGELADECELIVSELVTNAVVHGGTAVRLRLTARDGWVYVEIGDDGGGELRVSAGDLDATGGRGLLIVGTLARDWGVVPGPAGGKAVWFTLGE